MREWAKGTHQRAIAAKLGINRGTVYRTIKHARKQWQALFAATIEKRAARLLPKYEFLFNEALAAYERSVGLVEKTRRRTGTTDKGTIDETVVESEIQAGDPRHLEVMRKCLDSMVDISGTRRPTKTALTDGEGNDVPLKVIFAPMPERDDVGSAADETDGQAAD